MDFRSFEEILPPSGIGLQRQSGANHTEPKLILSSSIKKKIMLFNLKRMKNGPKNLEQLSNNRLEKELFEFLQKHNPRINLAHVQKWIKMYQWIREGRVHPPADEGINLWGQVRKELSASRISWEYFFGHRLDQMVTGEPVDQAGGMYGIPQTQNSHDLHTNPSTSGQSSMTSGISENSQKINITTGNTNSNGAVQNLPTGFATTQSKAKLLVQDGSRLQKDLMMTSTSDAASKNQGYSGTMPNVPTTNTLPPNEMQQAIDDLHDDYKALHIVAVRFNRHKNKNLKHLANIDGMFRSLQIRSKQLYCPFDHVGHYKRYLDDFRKPEGGTKVEQEELEVIDISD